MMIEVNNLTKTYGFSQALKGISFHVSKGEVIGFLGPNGAGKSTTLRILTGYLSATSGLVKINGLDIEKSPYPYKRQIGYMPESASLYSEMRTIEYLGFRAELKQIERKKRAQFIYDAIEQTKLLEVANISISHLSKGYRQRLLLADALLSKPPLLILDEPTSGLDPNQIRELRSLIQNLGQHHTVVLSTHLLNEVEAICNRVIVFNKGQIVAEGNLSELKRKHASKKTHVTHQASSGEKEEKWLELCRSHRGIMDATYVSQAKDGVVNDGTDDLNRGDLECLELKKEAKGGSTDLTDLPYELKKEVRVFQKKVLELSWDPELDHPHHVTSGLIEKLVYAGCPIQSVIPLTTGLEDLFSELTDAKKGGSA